MVENEQYFIILPIVCKAKPSRILSYFSYQNKAMAVENKAEKLGFRATYPELLREYEI